MTLITSPVSRMSRMLMKLMSGPTERAKKRVATKFGVRNLAEHGTLSSSYFQCGSCFLGSQRAS